jgi:hypothetical protein
MNAKKILWILVGATVLAGGYVAYNRYVWTKKRAIKYILANDDDAQESSLKLFGDDYLIARAKSIQSDKPTFVVDGKEYMTNTGKAKA